MFSFLPSVAFKNPRNHFNLILNVSSLNLSWAETRMSKILFAKNESRVWAMSFIAENNFFGPFNGDFRRLIKRIEFLDRSTTRLEDSGKKDAVTEYDSLQQDDNSWMKEAIPALSKEEQNMEAIRSTDDKIYFRTTRDITAGEELRFWLAPSLEKEYGLCTPKPDEMRDSQCICRICQESFQYSRALSVHSAFGCEDLGSCSFPHECKMNDSAGNGVLAAVNGVDDRFKTSHSCDQSEENQEHGDEIEVKELSISYHYFTSPDDDAPSINRELSETVGNSRVLSNPKLASLISSFSRPRFRKLSNDSQSLAEYHKQEFRKKFQGNEHYLRRHLYRENMEVKGSMHCRRPLTMKETFSYSGSQGDHDEIEIQERKEEYINRFRKDYRLTGAALSSSPTHELFRRKKTIDAQKHITYRKSLLPNDSLNAYCDVSSSSEKKETFITGNYPTIKPKKTQGVDEEPLSRETTPECTCHEHDNAHGPPKSPTAYKGKYSVQDVAMVENEQRNLNDPVRKFKSQTLHNSFESYFIYQRLQAEDHSQCRCYSTSALYEPKEHVTRYYEPAFLVDSMYRYSPYPRMLPFLTHHSANSFQTSSRNKGFTCEYCGKVYCRKYVLKIHMRTHTGFKPLRCKVCDKSFSDPSNMKKHVKLHETEDTVHKCRHCGRSFVRYRGLLNHIKSKHSEHATTDTL